MDDNDNNNVLVIFVILLYLSKLQMLQIKAKSGSKMLNNNDNNKIWIFSFPFSEKKETFARSTEEILPCLFITFKKVTENRNIKFNLILEVHFLPCDLASSMTSIPNVNKHVFRK